LLDSGLAAESEHFIIGDIVFVNGDPDKRGKICYIGNVAFASGEFAGIALDLPNGEILFNTKTYITVNNAIHNSIHLIPVRTGKHDGQVKGHRYFQCAESHGVFTKLNRVFREPLRSPQMSEIDGPAARTVNTPGRFQSPGVGAGGLPQALASPSERTPSPFGSKTSTPGGLQVGERVIVSSAVGGTKMGILRYLGPTDFAAGQWCGIELDKGHSGKNDGSVGGKRYFNCEDGRGLFVPISKVMASPMNRSNIRRHGSRESLASISSLASSVASRSTKRVSSQRQQCLPTCSMQSVLKEKENHVEHLLKEREMDRVEMINVARKLEECSHEFRATKEAFEKCKAESAAEIEKLQLALDEERRKYEDLQYSLDEEKISKSELAGQLESLAKRATNDQSNLGEIERLQTVILEHKNSIKDLNDTLAVKSKAVDTAESTNVSLRNDNENLKTIFAKVEQDIQEKNLLLEESQGRIQHFNNLAQEKEKSEIKLLATVEELRSKQGDFKAEKSKLEEKVKELEQKHADLQLEIKEIVTQQDTSSGTLAQKLETSNLELRESKSKIDTLSNKITELKTTISTMQTNEKSLMAELDRQNAMNKTLDLSLAEKVKELGFAQEKYKREITDLQNASEAKINSLTEQLNHGNLQSSEAHGALEEVRVQKEKLLSDNLALGTAKADLESQVQKLQGEMEVLRNNASVLEDQLLDQKKVHSADYHKLLQTYKEAVSQCNDLKAKIVSVEAEIESKSSLLTAATSEISVKQTEVQNLQKIVEELKTKCKELEDNVAAKSSNVTELENQLRAIEAKHVELQDEKQRLDALLKDLEDSNVSLKDRAEKAEVEGKELKASLVSAETQLSDKLQELEGLKDAFDESSKRIILLEEEKRVVEAKLLQLELDVKNKASEMGRNLSETSKVVEELQQAQKELQTRGQLISSLEEELKIAKRETAQLSNDLQETVKKLNEHEKQLETRTLECKKMQSEFATKDDLIGELEQGIAQLKQQSAYLEKKIDEKNKTIVEFQSKLDQTTSKPAEVTDKEFEINLLSSVVADLQKKNDELNAKVNVLLHGASTSTASKRYYNTLIVFTY